MLIMKSQADVQTSTVTSLSQKWNEHTNDFVEKQKVNPFSGRYEAENRPKWTKGDPGYAQPVGTTAVRREKANKYIDKELDMLISVMRSMADTDARSGIRYVTFGPLFQRYTKISSNLVGILIRARKRNLVDFDGEMLWQRRDDDVIITLIE
ncbi:actin-binding Rho-activating protein-like [Styela clava]|uniref:actin-binding Rho-activating protein-like n=1 Tax=Styela clava TaxID=7725 RepID=UPI001939E1A2|nr:actin-binding Rho-activating protein-like [Styela clava]